MIQISCIIFCVFFFFNYAYAASFDVKSCSFEGIWDHISESKMIAEIDYNSELFESALENSSYSTSTISDYANTFSVYKIGSPEERLNNARKLWLTNNYKSKNEISGIVGVIEKILDNSLGKMRAASCLEWGLFYKSMQEMKVGLDIPLYLEFSGSIWKKGNRLKILLEFGQANKVTSDLTILSNLFNQGWKQIMDVHNHPALHKHPIYYNISDTGPNLFPSPADGGYWAGTIKFGNRIAIITDGLSSIAFESIEFEEINKIYVCSKYPSYYECKN